MRKKMNIADQFYIDHHCLSNTAEEISEAIGLQYNSLFDYFNQAQTKAKKKEKEKSNGVAVLTEADSMQADDIAEKTVKTPNANPDLSQSIWRG